MITYFDKHWLSSGSMSILYDSSFHLRRTKGKKADREEEMKKTEGDNKRKLQNTAVNEYE